MEKLGSIKKDEGLKLTKKDEELELIKKDLSDIKGKLMAIDAAAYLALSNIEELEVPESVDREINKKVIETAIMIQGGKDAKATKGSSKS